MATHSSILARRIPWTGEPGGLWSTGHKKLGDCRDGAHMHTPLGDPEQAALVRAEVYNATLRKQGFKVKGHSVKTKARICMSLGGGLVNWFIFFPFT